ncbi:MAG: hypothetical protein WC475_03135, partial [Candidatus Paceibacterota bacterium]
SLKQINELGDKSIEALFKLSKICNFFSYLHVDEKLKKDKIETGMNIIERLKKSRIGGCMEDNILGFLYLKKAKLDNENREENYQRGLSLIKNSIAKMNSGYINNRTMLIYSFAGTAFFDACGIKLKNKVEKLEDLEGPDFENLIKGIVYSELGEKFGNKEAINNQIIGRSYYLLQHLMERADVSRMKNKISQFLIPNYSKEMRLHKLIDLKEDGLQPNQLRNEMKSIALKYALDAFRKNSERGDDSLDNKSYTGMCLVDLVRLRLKESREETSHKTKLAEAESLLESVLNERKTFKDYTRLAECKYRLAGMAENSAKKDLYLQVKELNCKAIEICKKESIAVKTEVYSLIAGSLFKFAEISDNCEEKRKNLEEALKFFRQSNDGSPENSSKTAQCSYDLLKLKLEEKSDKKRIAELIGETKKSLEEAINNNKRNNGNFIYPYFSLYFLARTVKKSGMSLRKYGLSEPKDYMVEALKNYEKNPNLQFERKGQSLNLVYTPLDNYGLLEPIFMLKKGKMKYLEKEVENATILNKKLKRAFGKDRKFLVVDPFSIITNKKSDGASEKYYIMRKEMGTTLDKIIENKLEEDIVPLAKDVVEFLGFIHSKMGCSKSKFEYEPFIRRKLGQIGADEGLIEEIAGNYAPIKNDLKGGLFVFNKDAHTRNWMIDKKRRIIALDFEEKMGGMPAEVDLAGLLEYMDIGDDDKKMLVGEYRKSLEKYSTIKNRIALFLKPEKAPSMRRYLNATFPKAISIISWPQTKKEEKLKMLQNVGKNMRKLAEIDPIYYNKFSDNYCALLKGLDRLMAMIESKD